MLSLDTPDTVLSLGRRKGFALGEGGGRGIMKYISNALFIWKNAVALCFYGKLVPGPPVDIKIQRFSNPWQSALPIRGGDTYRYGEPTVFVWHLSVNLACFIFRNRKSRELENIIKTSLKYFNLKYTNVLELASF